MQANYDAAKEEEARLCILDGMKRNFHIICEKIQVYELQFYVAFNCYERRLLTNEFELPPVIWCRILARFIKSRFIVGAFSLLLCVGEAIVSAAVR
jgi:hypothetical protein